MNKKFLSAILFGALMVISTGTFVSCKDYDDDIDSINKELTDIKSQLAALQQKVDAGKWITGVSSTANGLAITMSDGQTLNITNGKDGAQGEAGAPGKDGKDGSVVEVKEGVLYINGEATEIKVAKEAPVALPCVKVENGELLVLGEDEKYVKTGIEAGCVTAAKVDGLWTITVGDDVITVPGSSAMSYIDVLNGSTSMKAIYAINKEDVTYSPYEKTLAKGLYTTLDRDLQIVVNPQGTDASVYDFSLMNSQNVNTELKFKDAVPYEGLLSRTASENAVWVLAHDFTRYEDITEARTKNYLLFKSNDGSRHSLTLSATSGETTVKTPYDLGASLQKLGSVSVYPDRVTSCAINKIYTPNIWTTNSVNAAGVYDYWLTIEQTPNNVKAATLYGVEIVNEGHGFRYTRETGVNNTVDFRYNYILIDGTVVEGDKAPVFTAWMTEEMASANAIVLERLETPLNAVMVPSVDRGIHKVFAYTTEEYSLDELTEQMTDLDKVVWKASTYYDYELIGGEGNNNSTDVNSYKANNIIPIIDKTKNTIKFEFRVCASYDYNFLLNNAYEYTMQVKDPDAENVVATITLPFEFSQPTLDVVGIAHQDGEYTKWSVDLNADGSKHCDVLYSFGAYNNEKMYLPLYEAFDMWTGKAPAIYTERNDNTVFYTLSTTIEEGLRFAGEARQTAGRTADVTLASVGFTYYGDWANYKTWALNSSPFMDAAISANKEASINVDATYKFYGVYPATRAQLGYYTDVDDDKHNGFRLVFASTIQKATMKMTESVLYANANTNDIFVSNDNVTATTMLGKEFVLFDGLYGDAAMTRAQLNNARGFNETQRPFAKVEDYEITAKYVGDNTSITSSSVSIKNGNWAEDTANGKYVIGTVDPSLASIQVWAMPSMDAKAVNNDYPKGMKAQTGGLIIVLGDDIDDRQPIEISIKIKDDLGFYNVVKVIAQKLD